MAKRIKSDINADLAAVNAEIAAREKFALGDAAKIAVKIADVPSAGGVERTLLLHLWQCGVASKASKKPFVVADAKAVVKAFNDHYYRDQGALTRAMPQKSSLDSKREAAVKFFTVGKECKYDSTPVVARVLAERSMNMPQRGTKLVAIHDKFKEAAPSDDELASAFEKRTVTPRDYKADSDLKALCSSIERRMTMEPLVDAMTKGKDRKALIFAEMQRLAAELRTLLPNTDNELAKRKPIIAAVAKLPKSTNVVTMQPKAKAA